LQKLLKQVVEEKQRKEKRQQVLAELEERAKRAEKEFARRASPVTRANLRRQLTQAEENLMDAYKRMREQKKKGADAEASRSAEGQEKAGQPETEAGAGGQGAEGGDQPPASEQDRSDAGRDEASREGAASDVARRLASRAREIAKLDRTGKAGRPMPTMDNDFSVTGIRH
jgi:chromosome segregation ATPase